MASSNNTEATTETVEIINQWVQAQSNPIFLQTTAAQVIAGLFVWTAVFVTCQQVKFIHFILVYNFSYKIRYYNFYIDFVYDCTHIIFFIFNMQICITSNLWKT